MVIQIVIVFCRTGACTKRVAIFFVFGTGAVDSSLYEGINWNSFTSIAYVEKLADLKYFRFAKYVLVLTKQLLKVIRVNLAIVVEINRLFLKAWVWLERDT